MRHASQPFYALVKALIEQHGYTPQKAFDTVWYSRATAKPYRRFNDGQILAWCAKVKVAPIVQVEDFTPKRKRVARTKTVF